jgi:hypothetical protein
MRLLARPDTVLRWHRDLLARHFVTNGLDTLTIYVKTDVLNDSPQYGPWRPAVGIAPRLSDAELVTLAMMQAMLGFTYEARWASQRSGDPYLSAWSEGPLGPGEDGLGIGRVHR